MELYDSEEQQVEAIKDWWKENGKAIIIGVVVGLGGILGWHTYQDSVQEKQESASNAYVKATTVLLDKGLAGIDATQDFITAHQDSAYAVLAAMQLAKVQLDDKQVDAALEQLQWALSHTDNSTLQAVLNFRIARVLVEQKNYSDALAKLDAIKADSWLARVQELRGDIALLQGDKEAATAAYTEAQQATNASQALQLKLDDLAK